MEAVTDLDRPPKGGAGHDAGPEDVAEARAATPRWGLGYAAVGFLGGFLAANVTVGLWVALAGSSEQSLGTLVAGWLGLWAGFLGVPLLVSRRKGTASLVRDFGLRAQASDTIGFLVGAACQLLAVPALYFLIQRLTGDLDVSGPARELTERVDGAALVIVAVFVALVAPVIEELFYRGLMLRAAVRRFGTRWAVVGTSAVFGISHFQLVQFPGLFGFGLVLAILAVRTGRLGASIAAHVAFNSVAVVGLVLAR